MRFSPEQYSQAREQILELIRNQLKISNDPILNNGSELTATYNETLEEHLRVLVMGKFNAGKSTFLNALMGKALLPMNIVPTTIAISEITYDSDPHAILHFYDNPAPKKVAIEDIDKYTIDHNAEGHGERTVASPIEKIEVKYPLEICRQGVMLVDSPGLDDPTQHDKITTDYSSKADAVIYLMQGLQMGADTDLSEVRYLRDIGYTKIIFVITYMDLLEMNDMMSGTNTAETVRNRARQLLSRYTDLGENGIFFVGSRNALNGRTQGNQKLVEASHILPLEEHLEQILYDEKGRLKLTKALIRLNRTNATSLEALNQLVNKATLDKKDLQERLNAAKAKLSEAKDKADTIRSQIKSDIVSLKAGAGTRAQNFLFTQIVPSIETWVADFKPGEDEKIRMLHPKKSSQAFVEACMRYIKIRMESAVAQWVRTDLVPNYISPEIERICSRQNANIEAFRRDLESINAILNPDIKDLNNEPSTENRIGSAILGFIGTGGLGAILGGAMGIEAVIAAIVANIVLYTVTIGIFGAISFPVAIILSALASLFGAGIGISTLESKTRKEIVEKCKQEFSKQGPQFGEGISNSVYRACGNMVASIDELLNEPITNCQHLLEELQRTINTDARTLDTKISKYKALLNSTNDIQSSISAFSQTYQLDSK